MSQRQLQRTGFRFLSRGEVRAPCSRFSPPNRANRHNWGSRHNPPTPNPIRSGRTLPTTTPTGPAASFSRNSRPDSARYPRWTPPRDDRKHLHAITYGNSVAPKTAILAPLCRHPCRTSTVSTHADFAANQPAEPAQTQRKPSRWVDGIRVVPGRVVRSCGAKGAGSNLPIETNVGLARRSLPFRPCAPGFENH